MCNEHLFNYTIRIPFKAEGDGFKSNTTNVSQLSLMKVTKVNFKRFMVENGPSKVTVHERIHTSENSFYLWLDIGQLAMNN